MKLSRTLPVPCGFPVAALAHIQPELSTHSSPHLLCWCNSTWGQGLLQSRGAPLRELGGGTISDLAPHLYEVRVSIAGTHRGRRLGVVQSSDWCWNCQSLHPHPCRTPTAAPLAPAMLPFCQCLEGDEHTLRGNEASWDLVFSALVSAAWDLTLPPVVWCWPLSREDLAHIWLWPQPFHLQSCLRPR